MEAWLEPKGCGLAGKDDKARKGQEMEMDARSDCSNGGQNLSGVRREWGAGWVKCSETVLVSVNSGL